MSICSAVFNYRWSIYRFSFNQAPSFFFPFLHVCYINNLLGDIIIIFCCLLSQTFSPRQRSSSRSSSSPLSAQVSHSRIFHIMYDVPSTPVVCVESIECFHVLYLYFGRFLFFLSLAKRLLFQHVS
jgi:hypothetical protein